MDKTNLNQTGQIDTMTTMAMEKAMEKDKELEAIVMDETKDMESEDNAETSKDPASRDLAFEKKSRVARSPLPEQKLQGDNILPPKQMPFVISRPRSMSLSGRDTETGKRKRVEISPTKDDSNDRDKASQLKSLLDKIFLQGKIIERIVEESYKCKKELKEASIKLNNCADHYLTKGLRVWLEEQQEGGREKDAVTALQKENTKLRNQIYSLEQHYESKIANMGASAATTQGKCEACLKAETTEEKWRALLENVDYESFKTISDEEWLSGPLNRIKVIEGPILEAPEEHDLMLPCNSEFNTSTRETLVVIKGLGGIKGLEAQNKCKGQMALMVQAVGFPVNGQIRTHSRHIYYPILTNGKEKLESAGDEDIFKAVTEIRESMIRYERTHLCIPEIEGIIGVVLDRCLEFVFAGTSIQITKYGTKGRSLPRLNQASDQKDRTTKQARSKKLYNSKEDSLIIKMEGKSYVDALKKVREDINPKDMGVEITDIRKTKSGDLLLRMKKDEAKLKVIQEEISKKIPGASAAVIVDKKVVHIKGMDEATTIDEIRESITETIQVGADTFEVKALRPSGGSKQNATLIMRSKDADKLLDLGKVRIGWILCRVYERVKEERCFKCWEKGHIKANCKGPDRGHLCQKCGQEGHIASTCTNKPFCIRCNKEGHQTTSYRCPLDKDLKATAGNG